MVTEGLPVRCNFCYEDELVYPQHAKLAPHLTSPINSLSNKARPSICKTSITSQVDIRPEFPKPTQDDQTPPSLMSARQSSKEGIPMRPKTHESKGERKKTPCENCALTLPEQKITDTVPMKLENSSPIMRTRKPYERVSAPIPARQTPTSPLKSESSDDERRRSDLTPRQETTLPQNKKTEKSPHNFSLSTTSLLHDHYLDYTSAREPLEPTSFSIVRQSCLRTLSCETLPPSSIQLRPFPTSPCLSTVFSSTSASGHSSGGPIFFGDPHAGYTTAYIFRIPDPNVRGRRRVYALMALTTKRERTAMQSFSYFSTAFRDLAQWILTLAELELERNESPRHASSNSTASSDFFAGGRSVYDGGALVLKNRGLAEILGMPDFFIELHSRFVRLLAEISIIHRS
ncbi:hypothetical protein K3495_g4859 [Podosphaera aphanis]|nr:hypothetical protein K3495_g4859 [Podosphaera aphanis]